MKNFVHIVNELIIFFIHIIVILLCTESFNDFYEVLKKALNYCVMIIWINNSTFTVVGLLIKFFELVKLKIASRRVEPEEKSEKRIAITNLAT